MIIDTHHHLWKYTPKDFGWINDSMQEIKRDFLIDDLIKVLSENNISKTIVVQARQCYEETDFLIDLAKLDNPIDGVIGWVNLKSPNIESILDKYTKNQEFKGVRHVLHDEPNDDFILDNDFQKGLAALAKRNLIYEILIFPKHFKYVIPTVAAHKDLIFILDHIGKPDIKNNNYEQWAKDIEKLSLNKNVAIKLSGMVTEAKLKNWHINDFDLYLDTVFDCFGEDRIMFGSDWPVCNLSANYSQVLHIVKNWAKKLTKLQQDKLFFLNAMHYYKL